MALGNSGGRRLGQQFNDAREAGHSTPGNVFGRVGGLVDDIFKRDTNTPDLDFGNFQLQGADRRREQLLQQADFAAGRQAPGIGQSQFRGNQNNLVSMLEARARGEGPSVAQRQLREGLGRNVASQQALLATGGSARAASQQASALGGSLSGQSALLRANEISQAQGLLGQTLQGARGLDLQRQTSMSDHELRSRGLNDQQIARLRELELRNAQSGLEGSMGFEREQTTRRGQDLGVPSAGERIFSAGAGLLTADISRPSAPTG